MQADIARRTCRRRARISSIPNFTGVGAGAQFRPGRSLVGSLAILCAKSVFFSRSSLRRSQSNRAGYLRTRGWNACSIPSTLWRGLVIASAMISGLGPLALAIERWRLVKYGSLDYARTMRFVAPSATLVASGIPDHSVGVHDPLSGPRASMNGLSILTFYNTRVVLSGDRCRQVRFENARPIEEREDKMKIRPDLESRRSHQPPRLETAQSDRMMIGRNTAHEICIPVDLKRSPRCRFPPPKLLQPVR
jgi:hypothetical protein